MIINQDCITAMRKMPSESVHACITSPPYFGLCDYQIDGQYGHEATLAAYLDQMSEVFSEVYRLLVEGGCCWIVIGDSSNNYSAIRAKGQRRATTIDKRRAIQVFLAFDDYLIDALDGYCEEGCEIDFGAYAAEIIDELEGK
jgi:DNA modification methylase